MRHRYLGMALHLMRHQYLGMVLHLMRHRYLGMVLHLMRHRYLGMALHLMRHLYQATALQAMITSKWSQVKLSHIMNHFMRSLHLIFPLHNFIQRSIMRCIIRILM